MPYAVTARRTNQTCLSPRMRIRRLRVPSVRRSGLLPDFNWKITWRPLPQLPARMGRQPAAVALLCGDAFLDGCVLAPLLFFSRANRLVTRQDVKLRNAKFPSRTLCKAARERVLPTRDRAVRLNFRMGDIPTCAMFVSCEKTRALFSNGKRHVEGVELRGEGSARRVSNVQTVGTIVLLFP